MKAGAVRDVDAKPSMVTPIASSMAEAILPIMQYIGIQKLEVVSDEASNLKKTSGTASFFKGTPEGVQSFANIMKDALAEIIAAAGMKYVEIEADQNEIDKLVDSYEQLQAMYAAAKISSEDSGQPVVPNNSIDTAKKPSKQKKCTCSKTGCKVK
jgi:hypothetical protein